MPSIITQNIEIVYALLGFLVVIMIYVLIKIKTSQKNTKEIHAYDEKEVVKDIYDEPTKEQKQQPIKEEHKQPEKKQEPKKETLHVNNPIPEPINKKSQNPYNPNSHIATVEVPLHDKIVKENFKEFSNLKILIAEDNVINQKVISGLLNESGIELVFASDGLETISILNNQNNFDLILMDAHMPNMDGFEATRKIRQNPKYANLPIIALSGDVSSDDVAKMYASGMDAHLEKPLKMDALYDILYAFTKKSDELDTQYGIEISGGDESFYKEILKEFYNDYKTAHRKILEFVENNQIKQADAYLLDIIGITANIGAHNVQKHAQALKQILQDKEEEKYQQSLHSFYNVYEKLINEIASYLEVKS